MESIKHKMACLIREREESMEKAIKLEAEKAKAEQHANSLENETIQITKSITILEDKLDKVNEEYRASCEKLDAAEKIATDSELEVNALTRRMQLLEEEMQRTTERLEEVLGKLEVAEKKAEESEQGRKMIEGRSYKDEETLELQEIQLRDAKEIAEDSDRKYEEVTRKLKMVETDLERVVDRAEEYEAIVKKNDNNLYRLNQDLKDMDRASAKNSEREDNFENEISLLMENLKNAETRAEFAERTVDKLEKTVDYLEDQLYVEKTTYKEISEKLDRTLGDMVDFM